MKACSLTLNENIEISLADEKRISQYVAYT